MCGGTYGGAVGEAAGEGLSPRVRGNLPKRCGMKVRLRSIPTCAGEPVWLPSICYWWKVYPHVCGGTNRRYPCTQGEPGLSPRVRGNLLIPCGVKEADRSIPTCAGEPLHKLICGLGLYSPTECLCLAIFFFETVNPLYGAVILTPERPTHKEACGKAVGRLCLLRLRILVPRAGAGIPRSCEQLGARPSYSKMTEYPKAMM